MTACVVRKRENYKSTMKQSNALKRLVKSAKGSTFASVLTTFSIIGNKKLRETCIKIIA